MSNYGQDRLYGAIDDDDDFLEEWRSSWEPASHTRVNDVMEQETVTPEGQEGQGDDQAGYEPEGALSEADVTWGSWQAAPAMASEPETITEVVAAMEAAPEAETGATSQPEEPASQAEADEPETLTGEPVTAHSESAESDQAPDAYAPEAEAERLEAPEAEPGEPEAERLVAPDDAQEPDLVDWEPEPTHPAEQAAGQEPDEGEETGQESSVAEEGEAAELAPGATEEPSEDNEPDHGVGLTGAAAAALAAASAWGVWGGTPAVPSMPAPSPFPVAEPESEPAEPEVAQAEGPEVGAEAQPFADAAAEAERQAEDAAEAEPAEAEPEPSGLYVPEPEVLRIPEPQPSADEPEHASFSPGLVTTPIPEPDMYAAPGLPPFRVPEPEPYVIPEPQPSSEPSPFARPTGDTTPIPEPGFVPEFTPQIDAPQIAGTEPTLVPHEQVHLSAGDSDAYDLGVDVYSVLGFPPPAEPTPPSDDTADPESTRQDVDNDEAADARFGHASGDEHDEPAAEGATSDELVAPPEDTHEERMTPEDTGIEAAAAEPVDDEPATPSDDGTRDAEAEVRHVDAPSAEAGPEHSEHPRWFDRAKMWAANNLYDPDEDRPADTHPQDEQSS